jgi:phospholipid/cholesterol/gamma-HCH transport system permease protein
VVTLIGGAALASIVMDVHIELQFKGLMDAVELSELAMSFTKSLAFGLVISAASCYHGMSVRSSITEVPQVTTRAVMQSLVLVVFMDAIITGLWAI